MIRTQWVRDRRFVICPHSRQTKFQLKMLFRQLFNIHDVTRPSAKGSGFGFPWKPCWEPRLRLSVCYDHAAACIDLRVSRPPAPHSMLQHVLNRVCQEGTGQSHSRGSFMCRASLLNPFYLNPDVVTVGAQKDSKPSTFWKMTALSESTTSVLVFVGAILFPRPEERECKNVVTVFGFRQCDEKENCLRALLSYSLWTN